MFNLFTVFAMRGNSVVVFLFMSPNAGDLELALDLPSNVWLFSMSFSLFVSFQLVRCFEGI